MTKIIGKHWTFIMVNIHNQLQFLCPSMVKIEEVYFDIDACGLKRNFYDNALFKSKEDAINAMIKQLEELKNG